MFFEFFFSTLDVYNCVSLSLSMFVYVCTCMLAPLEGRRGCCSPGAGLRQWLAIQVVAGN